MDGKSLEKHSIAVRVNGKLYSLPYHMEEDIVIQWWLTFVVQCSLSLVKFIAGNGGKINELTLNFDEVASRLDGRIDVVLVVVDGDAPEVAAAAGGSEARLVAPNARVRPLWRVPK